jgi:O-antigen/teichoic acid export membrane protein
MSGTTAHGSESSQEQLIGKVRGGLAWSSASAIVLRLGSFAIGVALARILSPEDFGVYALALTVQAILLTLADMGLSADLIRSEDPARLAPTVGALGLLAGCAMTVIMVTTAPAVAAALGSLSAAPVIAVLSVSLALAGAGVVPYAFLQRRFDQRKLFAIAVVDLLVSTSVTFSLLAAGVGVMSLAIGRVVAQVVTLILQFTLARVRPNYRLDPRLVRPVLRFGTPIAAANLLSWALMNIDYIVISRTLGTGSLGFYVLAFNVASWPMSTIGHVARSVALPAFAAASRQDQAHDRTLSTSLALAWLVALPTGALLAVLSLPLIQLVYGEKWAPSAPVLAALGLFGAMRVVFDISAAYLLARGASTAVLRIQLLWFVSLVPAITLGARLGGVVGVGWAHVSVAVLITFPAYLIAMRSSGADSWGMLKALWPPLVAIAPASAAAAAVAAAIPSPLLALLAAGSAGAALYALLMQRWARRVLGEVRQSRPESDQRLGEGESAATPPAGDETRGMNSAQREARVRGE